MKSWCCFEVLATMDNKTLDLGAWSYPSGLYASNKFHLTCYKLNHYQITDESIYLYYRISDR